MNKVQVIQISYAFVRSLTGTKFKKEIKIFGTCGVKHVKTFVRYKIFETCVLNVQ